MRIKNQIGSNLGQNLLNLRIDRHSKQPNMIIHANYFKNIMKKQIKIKKSQINIEGYVSFSNQSCDTSDKIKQLSSIIYQIQIQYNCKPNIIHQLSYIQHIVNLTNKQNKKTIRKNNKFLKQQNIIFIKTIIDKALPYKLQNMTESDVQYQRIIYASPPNIDDCYSHRRANIIFKKISHSEMEEVLFYNYCQCCGRIVGKEPELKFSYDPIQAAYLGPGIPLFFALFRSVLYTLLIYIVGFGLYTTFTDINGNNCQTNCGTYTLLNQISIFNIFNQVPALRIQIYFELAMIVGTIFVNISIRSYINYLQIYIDQFFAKPSDYSIIIRNIPEEAKKQDIEQMIHNRRVMLNQEQIQKTQDLKVVDILVVKQLKQYLEREKKNLQTIKAHIKNKQKDPELGDIYCQNPIVPTKFARTAIVIFSNALSKQFFINSSNQVQTMIRTLWGSYYARSSVHKIKGQFVSIYRAPEPDDLVWQNCGKKSRQLLVRRIGLYILSFMILGLGASIQYLIQFIRFHFVKPENQIIQFVYSLGAAITVTTFNFLISQVLEFMAFHQGHDTKTQLRVALTFRIVLYQFLNSGIFVVLSNIFVRITSDANTPDFRKTVLSSNIVQMMVMNAINGNFMTWIFNRYELFNQWNRRKILKKTQLFPQIQANQIFQGPNINIHLKYAYILKTLWLTAFFMPAVPPVIAISFFGLLLNYWIEKYLFSGAYTAPEAISSYLSNHVLNLLDYTPLWITLGSFFLHLLRTNFDYNNVESEIKSFHYLFFFLSIVNIFLPYYSILKRLNRYREPRLSQTTYEQSVCTFELTYEDTNPIYANHKKKRVRDEEVFKQQLVKETEFQQMRMSLSQSQIIVNHKQSLLKSSFASQINRSTIWKRASSPNF